MLSAKQVASFRSQGYLVVENLLDDVTLHAVREEYRVLMDQLYRGWVAKELVPDADNLDSYSFTDATLFSGDKRINSAQFKDTTDGQVMLRQTNPYPWTVLGIMQKVDVTDR